MATTGPYRPDAEMFLRDRVQHLHRVTAYVPGDNPYTDGMVLDLVSATVTLDEDRAPRWEFNGTVGLIEDQDVLDLLDPRRGIRLLVEVGYRWPDQKTELYPLCDLLLDQRNVRRPSNTIDLLALSDERIVQQQVGTFTFVAGEAKTTAVQTLLSQGHQQPVQLVSPRLVGAFTEELKVEPGAGWSTLQSLLDEARAEVFHDGLTGFFVRDQVETPGSAVASFTTGRTGTITATETALDRETFANYVVVVNRWRTDNGTDQTVFGAAEQTSGPYGTATVGRVGLVREVDRRASTAAADAQARAILYRSLSRGRRLHFEDSAARYWIRPGDTVVVTLPLGPPERPIVSSVTFNLPDGSMSVHTRQPQ